MKDTKGFTLIELLVVISIIALLASVVLAALSSARDSSKDASVKQNLSELRKQAAVYYDKNYSYGSVGATPDPTAISNSSGCATASSLFVDPVIAKQINAAISAGNGITACQSKAGVSGAWAATANLKSNPNKFWCVDSRGVAASSTNALPVATPNTTYAANLVSGAKCN